MVGHMETPEKEIVVVGAVRQPRGAAYWIIVGWWWGPIKWMGRIALWIVLWPLGLWRTWAQHRKNQERRTGRSLKDL